MDVGVDGDHGVSDADHVVYDKHGDDDVTCGVGWLYWQEVWRNRGMREWSCEVTPPDRNTKTNTLSNTKKRPSSKRKYRHTMSNESQMYLQCEKETIKILTKSPLHPFSVKGVCCIKCEMMHPLGITCLSH